MTHPSVHTPPSRMNDIHYLPRTQLPDTPPYPKRNTRLRVPHLRWRLLLMETLANQRMIELLTRCSTS
ncbi:cytokinesis protein sepA [Histoplasma capsulatum G186AR]|uniref:Cytokinesis protein sepA n=1 Tax=Ajellomyces capsulatus TaxID=5037 RepID=A0A8H7YTT3_AJECA|nr:cytokinesis protein sepA [Histoplasma capsulatum]QSS74104.1 cytokinesis protein sepA [Histoplasma capsulatum G186AR]